MIFSPVPLVRLVATATFALLTIPALAQSNVSLYGRINTSIENQKDGSGQRVTALNDNASRLGIRVNESLGSGLFAGIQLESGFDSSTGANASAGAFFNRRSHIDFGSSRFGSVRMSLWLPGSYFAIADYVSLHNHDTGRSADALYSFVAFTKTNKIAYISPNWMGFRTEVSIALGERTAKNTIDVSAQYDVGSWHLGAAYASQSNKEQFAIRALYDWNQWTLGGYVQRENVESSLNGDSRKIARLVAMYKWGQSEVHLNGGYTQRGGSQSERAAQYTLAYNYNLSKRTKLYTYYTAIDSASKIKSSDSFAVGVRHNF